MNRLLHKRLEILHQPDISKSKFAESEALGGGMYSGAQCIITNFVMAEKQP